MKAFVIIGETARGELATLAGSQSAPVLEAARAARDSGKLAGKDIVRGLVISPNHSGPLMRFACNKPVKPSKK